MIWLKFFLKRFVFILLFLLVFFGQKVFATADVWHPLYESDDFSLGYMSNHGYVSRDVLRTLTAEAFIASDVMSTLKDRGEVLEDQNIHISIYSEGILYLGKEKGAEYRFEETCSVTDARGEPLVSFAGKPCLHIDMNHTSLAATHKNVLGSLLQSKTLYEKDENIVSFTEMHVRYQQRIGQFAGFSFEGESFQNKEGFSVQEVASDGEYFVRIGKDEVVLVQDRVSSLFLGNPVFSADGTYVAYALQEGVFVYNFQTGKRQFYAFYEEQEDRKDIYDLDLEFKKELLFVVHDKNLFDKYYGILIDVEQQKKISKRFLLSSEWGYEGRQQAGFPWDDAFFMNPDANPYVLSRILVKNVDIREDSCWFQWKKEN